MNEVHDLWKKLMEYCINAQYYCFQAESLAAIAEIHATETHISSSGSFWPESTVTSKWALNAEWLWSAWSIGAYY